MDRLYHKRQDKNTTDHHAVSAVFGSRPDRPGFSQLKKINSAGGNPKNTKVRAGGAGQPLAGKRRGLLRSAVFLKMGSSLVVQGHQENVRLFAGHFLGSRGSGARTCTFALAKAGAV